MASSSPKEGYRKSRLLSKEENEQVRGMLGEGCQGLATSVIQLFMTSPPDHKEWTKRDAGILCLVKDNVKRSYFLRLFCLKRQSQVWEMEIYRNMEYDAPKPFLHVFEGQDCVIALNFADEAEAEKTYNIINTKLEKCRQKDAKRALDVAGPSRATDAGEKGAAALKVAEAGNTPEEEAIAPEAEKRTQDDIDTPADVTDLTEAESEQPEPETYSDAAEQDPSKLDSSQHDNSDVTVIIPPSVLEEVIQAEPQSVEEFPEQKTTEVDPEKLSLPSPSHGEDIITEPQQTTDKKESEPRQPSVTIHGSASETRNGDITTILAKARELKEAREEKEKEMKEMEEGEKTSEEKEAKKDEQRTTTPS